MSLLLLAWRNFQQRSLASILTTISLALGTGLTVLVLAIYGLMTEAFQRNTSVGYNLVVGAKGSPLQLTLNSVYYLSQPIENVPYSYMMEFYPAAERQRLHALYGGKLEEPQRDGKFSKYTAGGLIIPLCLGDYFGQYRVVGTSPEFFNQLKWGPDVDRPYEFQAGRNFVSHSPEHGYFEAVLGARVAATMNMKVGDSFNPAHGDPEGKGHKDAFTVVGILKPTGTANDRATFVNIEGFYLMEGHAKPVQPLDPEKEKTTQFLEPKPVAEGEPRPLMIDEREVTAILLKPMMPQFAIGLQNIINEGEKAQAAAPIGEITKMMVLIIEPINWVLLTLTVLTCVVAAVGILVSIYNSMNDRRRDIAVMRALGARQDTVMWVILLESGLIAVLGGIAGWLIAHVVIALASNLIEERIGIVVGFLTVTSTELMVVPIVLALAALAGLLPALMAYRTDVGRNLQG